MIILMGAAGSGKSMQGKILADEYGYAWISTGEVLRVLITGRRRHEMIEGRLLEDNEVINVVDKVLELIDTETQFIVDGFPRTRFQVDWMMMQAQMGRLPIPVVFNLEVDEQIIRERLYKRNRPDDTEEAISRRFAEYERATRPILDHMKELGIQVVTINADQTPADVHRDIVAKLEELKQL